jgi:ECF sigma factor
LAASDDNNVTRLLHAWREGNLAARDELMPLVYDELRRRAAAHLRRERGGHTLQPTALVHEAYLRMVDQRASWRNRSQFFAVPRSDPANGPASRSTMPSR